MSMNMLIDNIFLRNLLLGAVAVWGLGGIFQTPSFARSVLDYEFEPLSISDMTKEEKDEQAGRIKAEVAKQYSKFYKFYDDEFINTNGPFYSSPEVFWEKVSKLEDNCIITREKVRKMYQATRNYEKLHPKIKELIDSNDVNNFRVASGEGDVVLYGQKNRDFYIGFENYSGQGRFCLIPLRIYPDSFLFSYKKEEPINPATGKPWIFLSATILKKIQKETQQMLSEDDKQYLKDILSILNENFHYYYGMEFVSPAERQEYTIDLVGKLLPRKNICYADHALTFMEGDESEQQKEIHRWLGHPVYDWGKAIPPEGIALNFADVNLICRHRTRVFLGRNGENDVFKKKVGNNVDFYNLGELDLNYGVVKRSMVRFRNKQFWDMDICLSLMLRNMEELFTQKGVNFTDRKENTTSLTRSLFEIYTLTKSYVNVVCNHEYTKKYLADCRIESLPTSHRGFFEIIALPGVPGTGVPREQGATALSGQKANSTKSYNKSTHKGNKQGTPHDKIQALAEAVVEGDLEKIKKTLKSGADVNKEDAQGNNALHTACLTGQVDSLKLLLKVKKADVNLLNREGLSPLHIATLNNEVECVRLLLMHKKLDVNLQTKEKTWFNLRKGYTSTAAAIHIAAGMGHEECLSLLLKSQGINVNLKASYGWTALSLATMCIEHVRSARPISHPKCVKLLLEIKGIETNPNVPYVICDPANFGWGIYDPADFHWSQTELAPGYYEKQQLHPFHLPLMEGLLKFHISRQLHKFKHYYPSLLKVGNTKILAEKIFIENFAHSYALLLRANKITKYKDPEIAKAIFGTKDLANTCCPEFAYYLVKYDLADREAVMGVMEEKHFSRKAVAGAYMEYFMSHEEDPNKQDTEGRTLLMNYLAIGYTNENFVEQCLNKGADVNLVDNQGKSPLIHATASKDADKNLAEVELLLKKGAKVSHRDKDNHTALWYAVEKNRGWSGLHKMVELLLKYGAKPEETAGITGRIGCKKTKQLLNL